MTPVSTEELADLQLFADPFDEFRKAPSPDGWTVNLVRKGEAITLRRESNGVIRTLSGPGQARYRNFKGLLVSEAFANLERLASAQMFLSAGLRDPTTGNLKQFLPVTGEIRYGDGSIDELEYESICELLEQTDDRLRIFIVDGSAGVGKSHLIERIVRARANSASYKTGKPLLLHIESRGKVLTSLNDRIAGTLSSLRASFFEEELKPLIRRGVVQLAIDGFDELSDSRGYVRAWGALRDFIRDLGSKGTCVLAGRDTMLDPVTVREGLGDAIGRNDLIFLRLQHPPADQVRVWLSTHPDWGNRNDALKSLERQIEGSEYLRRPFFVSRIADLGPDHFQDAAGEPIAELMESILRREGDKLTGASADIHAELASELCNEVLSETARLMLDDETDEIEVGLVELLLEEVFRDHANPEMIHSLVQRARTLTLLEEDKGDSNRRTFPHETVRSYFFAQSIFSHFPEHGATTGLYRVPLSADNFRIFNRVARRRSLTDQEQLRQCMLAKLRETGGYDYLRSNIGGLLLSFAPLEEDGGENDTLALAHLQLRDVWMADLLGVQKIHLNGCHFHRLDVRGADLERVRFSNTEINELLVDPFVKFGAHRPRVHSIALYEHFKETRLFDGVSEWIEQRALKSAGINSELDERWYLLEKFARISMRQYAIRSLEDQMDPASKKILASPLWPSLRELLERYERLEVDSGAPASGPRSEWYHLVAGSEFLNPSCATRHSTRRILEELNASSGKPR